MTVTAALWTLQIAPYQPLARQRLLEIVEKLDGVFGIPPDLAEERGHRAEVTDDREPSLSREYRDALSQGGTVRYEYQSVGGS